MEKELKNAIIRGLSKQVIPGEVDTVDNIYNELDPVIEAIINSSMKTAVAEIEKAFNEVE